MMIGCIVFEILSAQISEENFKKVSKCLDNNNRRAAVTALLITESQWATCYCYGLRVVAMANGQDTGDVVMHFFRVISLKRLS